LSSQQFMAVIQPAGNKPAARCAPELKSFAH
jgi:hypothetical protein